MYIHDLVPPSDLERLVLAPLAPGGLAGSPNDVARSGRFPAPLLTVVEEGVALRDGLLSGLTGVHIAGYPAALLIGGGRAPRLESSFSSDTEHNLRMLFRHLPDPGVNIRRVIGTGGVSCAVAFVESAARPEVVQAVTDWAGRMSAQEPRMPLWRAALGSVRLPPAVECTVPTTAAAALQKGYIFVAADHLVTPLLAPTTLELLLDGPHDAALPPAVRRLVLWPRLFAVAVGLLLAAFLIAVTAYHHSLVPGPFLVAIASSRQNAPFPIVLEMFIVAFIGDAAEAASMRIGKAQLALVPWIGVTLAVIGAMQVGILGPLTGFASVVAVVVRDTLPSRALGRTVRIWRYFFMAAAAALGMYGMTLLVFAALIYLGEERFFAHSVRFAPDSVAS